MHKFACGAQDTAHLAAVFAHLVTVVTGQRFLIAPGILETMWELNSIHWGGSRDHDSLTYAEQATARVHISRLLQLDLMV